MSICFFVTTTIKWLTLNFVHMKFLKPYNFLLKYVILTTFIILIGACRRSGNDVSLLEPPEREKIPVLKKIIERGELIALTDFNSTDYFLYRGMPMGFQYELLEYFAKHLGVRLRIEVKNDMKETFDMLINGECDLIAKNLTVTKSRSRIVDFTYPHSQTRQVLVQRKPADWIMKSTKELDKALIRNQIDLARKKIFVQKNTSYSKRLQNLSDEIGDTIQIIETSRYSVEELIMLVSTGKIDYTVCDENVAKVNEKYYPNIDIKTAISFPQNMAWAVRKESNDLEKEINKWLKKFKKTLKFRIIYNKYFNNPRSAHIVNSDYYSLRSGKISIFDAVIKKESKKLDWDWRLIASLIYTESRFRPNARSWAGAYGLMQIMPCTFEQFGGDTTSSPAENIKTGIKLLKWLDKHFSKVIKDENERIKFMLGSYNVGYGHVEDAMRLAEKYGRDPYRWDNNVEHFLKLKSNPKYYKDSVVRNGYCRGNMPVIYVREILERYEHYKKLVKSDDEEEV